MDIRCSGCHALINKEGGSVLFIKLKGADDSFAYYHERCWVQVGRFHHLNIDYDYYIREMEAHMYRPKKT
jgi:extradiol dioxygenase family protein